MNVLKFLLSRFKKRKRNIFAALPIMSYSTVNPFLRNHFFCLCFDRVHFASPASILSCRRRFRSPENLQKKTKEASNENSILFISGFQVSKYAFLLYMHIIFCI